MSFQAERYETEEHLARRYADDRAKARMRRVPSDVPYNGVMIVLGFCMGVIATLIVLGVK